MGPRVSGSVTRGGNVTLRPARLEDGRRVWQWRNDPETRRASLNSSLIPLDTHEVWFRESLGRHDRRLYIVLEDGQESGVIRLDIRNGEAEVSIHLAPERRGRGLGPAALRVMAAEAFSSLGVERLVALVKSDNHASRKAFLDAAFLVADEEPLIRLVRIRP